MLKRALLKGTLYLLVLSGLGLLASPVSVADRFIVPGAVGPLAQPEPILAQIYRDIEALRLDRALDRVDALLDAFPNFRLGHLIKGDLLMARARPLATFGNVDNPPLERVAELRDEAIVRLKGYREKPPSNALPRYLLQMPPEQKFALLVDTQRSRLYVYENDRGRPRYAADYYITQGKAGAEKMQQGDRKTPIGVYFVTSNLPKDKLKDLYGSGAYPISYPNEWDRRVGRSGYGIWLHGTPSDTFSRPPRASDGCVVLANQDLDEVAQRLQIGVTPVIISNGIEWTDAGTWENDRRQLGDEFEQWRLDWESNDVDRYLAHYSARFASDRMNFSQWSRAKRDIASEKTWSKIAARNVSMFRSPGKDDLAVVTFEQDYRSNNLSNIARKRQYWQREDGHWKIVYEGLV